MRCLTNITYKMVTGFDIMRDWLKTWPEDTKLEVVHMFAIIGHCERMDKQSVIKYLDIVLGTIKKHESITVDEVVYEIEQIKRILS